MIEAEKVENIEAEFNADFITRMLPKLEWSALVKAAKELGAGTLPSELNESMVNDEAFLKIVKHMFHVNKAALTKNFICLLFICSLLICL